MRPSLSIGGGSSVQWRKVDRGWRLQMCFHWLLCVRIEIDQLLCVNCWVIIHCLSVSCTKINHSRCTLMIWSSLQLTSKQWIIAQQFTARADLFLKQWTIFTDICVITLLLYSCKQFVLVFLQRHPNKDAISVNVPIYMYWYTYYFLLSSFNHLSQCMRFPTMWYVRPAKPQISLRIRAVWSEPLLVAWVFYDC